jgi:prepilin-type N-terminal cleavage/methylation domain-containing protein
LFVKTHEVKDMARKGFTLIELLVVIAIIALLPAILAKDRLAAVELAGNRSISGGAAVTVA